MKKSILILSSLFLSLTMQAQIIPQPKSGPAPKVKIGKPVTFELPNGLKVLVVENHKLPVVSFNLSIDNPPYAEGEKKGVEDMLSSMIGSSTKKMSKEVYNEEIDFLGASVGVSAGGASASCLSKYSKRVLELMVDGAFNSNLTQEDFDTEKKKILEGLKSQEKNVSAVAGRVGRVLPFGKSHPFGEYLSETTLNNVTLQDVVNHYNTYFVPERAYLVVVGDVKVKDVKPMIEKLFGNWAKKSAPVVSYPDPKNVDFTQINFIDMPNAVQSEISTVNLVNLKMTDPDYFAALIANQIYGGDFDSYINMNLREAHGWTYGANSGIRGDRYISKFTSSTQVRNTVTDSAVVEILKELKRIKTEKVSEEVLKNVKAGYIGKFVMGVQKPQTVASFALRTRTQNLPEDFFENYVKNINAVTVDDVMKAANKYFLDENLRIIIVGKGTDVIPGLEKLKIPIFYFDKFGNPASKPALSKPVPAGVNVKTVMDNYIKAVGGEKAMKKVKTISYLGSTQIPQAPAPITYINKIDAKGKMLVEFKMGEMSMMKQVLNEKEAYSMQQGQKMNVEGEELEEVKKNAVPFRELELAKRGGVVLSSVEPIEGADAYAIVDGNVTYYYDVVSGLKIAESVTRDMGGQKQTFITQYKDYREVKGVKVPFETVQNIGIELDIKMSEVKINEGVSSSDFK
ncbi:MAG: M16 family metallopeptidase [Flavobacterium sp.]